MAEGFALLDGGEGNVALRDQQAALRWVRQEIAAFGGDPGNVTAFGQSAGAMTLGAMLGSPRSRGLFDRVILQSGAASMTFSPAQARVVAEALAAKLGVRPTGAAVCAVPIADVIGAQAELGPGSVDVTAAGEPDPAGGMLAFMPVRDGELVPADPLGAIAAGAGARVPLLIGDTTQEGRFYVAGSPDVDLTVAEPLTQDVFRRPVAALASAHRAASAPTWGYEFAWPSGAFGGRLGAAHAVELPFVFDTLGVDGLVGENRLLGPQGGPQELADRMHGAWVRFAKTGDPGWPQDVVQRFA